jgi:hypothetical protein
MNIIYTWEIPKMATKPQEGNLQDVVVIVYWIRTGTCEYEGKVYTSSLPGSMACETPSETDFTAYADLTKEQVVGWVEAGVAYGSFDDEIAKNIEEEINPPIVILPNPWDVPPTI